MGPRFRRRPLLSGGAAQEGVGSPGPLLAVTAAVRQGHLGRQWRLPRDRRGADPGAAPYRRSCSAFMARAMIVFMISIEPPAILVMRASA